MPDLPIRKRTSAEALEHVAERVQVGDSRYEGAALVVVLRMLAAELGGAEGPDAAPVSSVDDLAGVPHPDIRDDADWQVVTRTEWATRLRLPDGHEEVMGVARSSGREAERLARHRFERYSEAHVALLRRTVETRIGPWVRVAGEPDGSGVVGRATPEGGEHAE